MQLKWLEDFVTLAQARSFARAADQRSATLPAFIRRVNSLEEWVGSGLFDRRTAPVVLSASGLAFLEYAKDVVERSQSFRSELRRATGGNGIRVIAGRSTARTLMADLLLRAHRVGLDGIHVLTRDVRDAVAMMDSGQAEFLISFSHRVVEDKLDGRRFVCVDIAEDKLVPVTTALAGGRPSFELSVLEAVPFLDYSEHLLMHRIVRELLDRMRRPPLLKRVVDCDAPDALREYMLKGLGVAWLPWSMIAGDCAAKVAMRLGSRTHEAGVVVRMYRPRKRLHEDAEAFWEMSVNS